MQFREFVGQKRGVTAENYFTKHTSLEFRSSLVNCLYCDKKLVRSKLLGVKWFRCQATSVSVIGAYDYADVSRGWLDKTNFV